MKGNKSIKVLIGSGLVLILLASILVVGCPAPATTTPTGPTATASTAVVPTGKEIKWTWVSLTNPYVISSKANWIRIDHINEKLKGRFIINWVGGEEVIPVFEQPTAVRSGVIQGAFTSSPYYSTYVPAVTAAFLIVMPYKQRMESGFYDFYEQHLREAGFHLFWWQGETAHENC